MNLIINAKDAMPNGGTLTISTETLALDKFTVKDDLGEYLPSGYYTTITIEDTGLGITEETLNRIFEPFFTTKEQGKGTGLGLAMVHGFVKQSGGSILVESDLNQGTSFKLFFPAARKIKMQDRVEADVIAPSAASGTETILLVEDEVDVRTITHDILQLFGYKVFACAPAEALLLCQDLQLNGNGRIHLLLTDIIMPQINGYELAQEMAQTCPDLKILYMSGYTNDILPQQDDLQPAIHFIPKPFTPQQLTQKVRSVLDQ